MEFQILWTVAFAINLFLSGYLVYESKKDEQAAVNYQEELLAEWTLRAEIVRFISTVGFLALGVASFFYMNEDLFSNLISPVLVLGAAGILLNTVFTFIYRSKIYSTVKTKRK